MTTEILDEDGKRKMKIIENLNKMWEAFIPHVHREDKEDINKFLNAKDEIHFLLIEKHLGDIGKESIS